MPASCDRVFVYGTLRRGGSNHFRMEGALFITTATVRGRLYRVDWYPGLIPDASGDAIRGEVYQTSHDLLERLDAFEGTEYRRVMATAHPTGGQPPLAAYLWEWLGPCDEDQRIISGDWLEASR
jgi:gamma-glutamylcyclotransferase (GGCT)/AIG2-like uncharacterized protein YtfP